MGETGQVLVVTHLVENDSLTPSAVPLAPTASTLAFGCDFSGFAGMNGSPVQAKRIATPWAAPEKSQGKLGFYLQNYATVLWSSPAGQGHFANRPACHSHLSSLWTVLLCGR